MTIFFLDQREIETSSVLNSFIRASCLQKKEKRASCKECGREKKICVSNWRTFYILSTYLSSFLKKRSPKCMLTSSAKQQTSVELYSMWLTHRLWSHPATKWVILLLKWSIFLVYCMLVKVALSQKVEVDFPNCPNWVLKKLSWDFENKNSDCILHLHV